MASIAAQQNASDRLRTYLPSLEDRKGLILSHLMGFALFSEFALNFFRVSIQQTPITSIPIRLIALWLIIYRTNRTGRLRLGYWDYLIFGFVILSTIGTLVTATTNPLVPIEFEDVRRFVGVILGAYLYFLVGREALQRRGFRPDIVIKWLLAAFAWSAFIGVLQALNLFGARNWSMLYADPLLTALKDN